MSSRSEKQHSKFIQWSALILAMTLPFIASIFYFKIYSSTPAGGFLYAVTKLFTVAWPILVTTLILRERLVMPAMDWRHLHAIPLGAMSGIAIVLCMIFGLLSPLIGDAVFAAAPAIRAKAQQMGFAENYLLFAAFLSFLHSLIEEYYWRWFVFRRLLELVRPGLAHVLAGLAFASHHVIVLDEYFPTSWALFFGFCTAIGGMLWSFLYLRQGTLAGCWISHMIVDLGIMSVGYSFIKN